MSTRTKDTLEKLIALCQADPEKAKVAFETKLTWTKNMQSEVKIRDFPPIKIDVPPFLGGDNEGPTPPELLLASIGACFTDVLAGFAAVGGIRIESINVTVKGQIDLRGFLGIDKSVVPGFSKIKVIARVETSDDPEKVKELIDVAQQMAPVIDTLTRGPKLEIEKIINGVRSMDS